MPPGEAIIFGKFVRAVDGETRAEENRSFDLTPFKDTRGYFAKRKYVVEVGKESLFYAVVERDSYSIESAKFWNWWDTNHIQCSYYGFHMPGQADVYYIGTLFFDLEATLLAHRGKILIKDEFAEALEAFKQRNPKFTGKIVKSMIIADKSVPTRITVAKPGCRELVRF